MQGRYKLNIDRIEKYKCQLRAGFYWFICALNTQFLKNIVPILKSYEQHKKYNDRYLFHRREMYCANISS